jgi:hypothetical protein
MVSTNRGHSHSTRRGTRRSHTRVSGLVNHYLQEITFDKRMVILDKSRECINAMKKLCHLWVIKVLLGYFYSIFSPVRGEIPHQPQNLQDRMMVQIASIS